MSSDERPTPLHRTLGLLDVTVYAVGDILGAGIYALVGRVAGLAGGGAWLSFVGAAVIALLTGLSYAELVARFPVAAGAAAYCRRAFRWPMIAFLAGFLVLGSGVTSAAAISHAFVGYLDALVPVPDLVAAVALLALVTWVSYRGMRESARVNFALTAVELTGLLVVLVVGVVWVAGRPAGELAPDLAPTAGTGGILAGITVAFFAYVGFEDTVNVAEEVRNPSRVIPRAILIAVTLTTLVYVGVTVVAVLTVPTERLAGSDAPLLAVLSSAGVPVPAAVFGVVAMIAITNTGLLNLIMASRLTYGMSREHLLPGFLSKVHPVRRTPWAAVLTVFVLAAGLAVSGGVQVLAQTTSLLLLIVFTLVHAALIAVKRRGPPREGRFATPRWTPWLGALVCAGMTLHYPWEVYLRAAIVLAVGLGTYFAVGRRAST